MLASSGSYRGRGEVGVSVVDRPLFLVRLFALASRAAYLFGIMIVLAHQ